MNAASSLRPPASRWRCRLSVVAHFILRSSTAAGDATERLILPQEKASFVPVRK